MKTLSPVFRRSLLVSIVVTVAPALLTAQSNTNSSAGSSTAPATPSTTSAAPNNSIPQDDAAAKAAERKRRFEEARKKIEAADPSPQPSQSSAQGSSSAASSTGCQSSGSELQLSPNLVNMLVGDTQGFSLFDAAGHKLTGDADWSVDDSSVAEMKVQGGAPMITAKQTGTVRVRARVDSRDAEATVNVITPDQMKPGTIRWSAPSPPCTKPKGIFVAVPH